MFALREPTIPTESSATEREKKNYTNCNIFYCEFVLLISGFCGRLLAYVLMFNDIVFYKCVCVLCVMCTLNLLVAFSLSIALHQRSSLKIHFMIFSTRCFLTLSQRQRQYTLLIWFYLLSFFFGVLFCYCCMCCRCQYDVNEIHTRRSIQVSGCTWCALFHVCVHDFEVYISI